jgi:hypothetical protein
VAQTIDQIEAHIDRTRERLGADFRELEQRVSAATDWRTHYERAPQMFLGAAVAGGVVLALALSGKRSRREPEMRVHQPRTLHGDRVRNQTSEVIANMTSALIGLGAAKLMAYIDDLLPGFDQQYRQAAHTE